jgi:hypothetical protein
MEIKQITLLIVVAVISLEIGALTAYLIRHRQLTQLRNKFSRLMVALSYERKAAAQKQATRSVEPFA